MVLWKAAFDIPLKQVISTFAFSQRDRTGRRTVGSSKARFSLQDKNRPRGKFRLTRQLDGVAPILWECGSITEKELGERLHLDSGTLAPLLKRLDKRGLVKRERPDQNERFLQITLTDAGIAMQEDALSVPEAMKNCIGLNTEECSILRKLLDKSLSAMERRSKEECI